MEKTETRKDFLENEWYHVRYSGEIPEVALHSSIHFLTEDLDGPGLKLGPEDQRQLHDAVLARYREIILRDITPENREETLYRGVLRAICNWRRLKRFCQRHGMCPGSMAEEIGLKLRLFLQNEIQEVKAGLRNSCLNCSFDDLQSFALELDISLTDFGEDLNRLCPSIC